MLRKILLASIAAIVGYVLGARAGFFAGVRDYIENDGEMLERVAIQSDKFDYGPDGGTDTETLGDQLRQHVEEADGQEASGRHERTYQ